MSFSGDILDDFAQQEACRRSGPSYPAVTVEMGMLVEDRSSHFTGDVVRWSHEGVTLQNRDDYVRHFGWKPGGFLIEGRPVTLVRPTQTAAASQRITASGSVAGDGRAKVASEPDLGRGEARRRTPGARVGRRSPRARDRGRTAARGR